jgi:dTDP-4-dehydrorhamnose reductase
MGARFIHFSTDYVFDGSQSQAYKESDTTNPVSVYGKSKLAGEQAVQAVGGDYFIFRTSWVYAPWGKNFLNTMLRLASERDQLSVVNDQRGAPTSAIAIARAIQQVLAFDNPSAADLTGIYHLTNQGVTTWHGFAVAIFKAYEANRVELGWPTLKIQSDQVKAISTQEYPTPAKRPAFSSLDNSKLKQVLGVTLPTWQESLAEVLQQKTF